MVTTGRNTGDGHVLFSGEELAERGVELSDPEARERIYGMPYDAWKADHQAPADDAKKAAFETAFRENVGKKD